MIKKGMKVKILTGKDKNKEGEVMEIDRKSYRAKVKGINIVKKHVKTTKEKKGGIVSKENFIHLSNLKTTKNIKTEQEKFDLAASFQKTIEEILYKKTKIAFREFQNQNKIKEKIFVVAGGVAANKNIRSMLKNLCKEENYQSIFPPMELCGDNAAMIAMVGLEKFKLKQFDNLDYPAKPRWQLDEEAAFLKGAGVQL